MNKAGIYFDTSVPSAFYDERTPERMEMTRAFWKMAGQYDLFVSTLVIEELEQVSNSRLRMNLLELVGDCKMLLVNAEVEMLANVYVKSGVLPQKYLNDALHIAVAVVHGIRILASWNFKHFVNVKTRQMVNLINLKEGYGVIEIVAPPEI